MTPEQLHRLARLERSVSPDALHYLIPAWIKQPWGAHVTDQRYAAWECAYDRLAADADAGIPAAVEALAYIDADVTTTIRRLRETSS